jgi:Flp pilus assembly protein TadD
MRAAASQSYFEPCEFLLLEASLEEETGHPAEARALRRLAAVAPDCSPPARLRLLAAEDQASGRFEQAARRLRQAATLDPLDWQTLLAQALLDRATGQTGRARELVERARTLTRLSLDPAAVPLVRAAIDRGHLPDPEGRDSSSHRATAPVTAIGDR